MFLNSKQSYETGTAYVLVRVRNESPFYNELQYYLSPSRLVTRESGPLR